MQFTQVTELWSSWQKLYNHHAHKEPEKAVYEQPSICTDCSCPSLVVVDRRRMRRRSACTSSCSSTASLVEVQRICCPTVPQWIYTSIWMCPSGAGRTGQETLWKPHMLKHASTWSYHTRPTRQGTNAAPTLAPDQTAIKNWAKLPMIVTFHHHHAQSINHINLFFCSWIT